MQWQKVGSFASSGKLSQSAFLCFFLTKCVKRVFGWPKTGHIPNLFYVLFGKGIITDHVLSTRESNVFKRVCDSVHRVEGRELVDS